ncbi:TPA: hypothetical protein NJU31_000790 [Acinetobacter baumannii]|nr:hypothetical protein [Acinetobacter baumannii]
MTQIRIAEFCNKYGFTLHQIRHMTRTGKLKKISSGVIDEEQALHILSKRVHSALGYVSPFEFEAMYYDKINPLGQVA